MNKIYLILISIILITCCNNSRQIPSKTSVLNFYLEKSFKNENIVFNQNKEYHIFLIPKLGCVYCKKTAFEIFETTSINNIFVFTNIQKEELTLNRTNGLYIDSINIDLLPRLNFGLSTGTVYINYKDSIMSIVNAVPTNLDSLSNYINKIKY